MLTSSPPRHQSPPPTGHHGAIYALSRNPFFPKFFLSVGDWTTRVWNEDVRTPVVTSPYHAAHLTGGSWSPTRPGVFYTISHEGALEAWDYYHKQRDPVLSVQVSDRALTSFAVAAGAAPRLAGVGAADGAVTILQLSDGLVEQQENEKAVISAVGTGRGGVGAGVWVLAVPFSGSQPGHLVPSPLLLHQAHPPPPSPLPPPPSPPSTCRC